MIRAGSRDEYYPVFFVNPYKGNNAAFGFDLGSNKVRHAALEKARDTGKLTVSGRITLVQETGKQFGFLTFLPIYRHGIALKTIKDRRNHLLGFALGVFRIGSLFESVLAQHQLRADLNSYLFDLSAPANKQYLYHQSSDGKVLKKRPQGPGELGVTSFPVFRFDVGDRKWAAVFTPVLGSTATQIILLPYATLIAGLLLTMLLTVFFLSITGRERRITQLVETRTRELEDTQENLRRSEGRLHGAVDSLQEAFALYGPDDRLILCNEKYRSFHLNTKNLIKPGLLFEDLIRTNVMAGNILAAIDREEEHIAKRLEQHHNPTGPIIR